MQTIRRFAALVAVLAAAGAYAQDERPLLATSRENWPTEITRRPLTLAQGMFEITAPLNANISKGADWKPWTLNPSLYVGLTDRWMLGVRHLVGVCFGGTSEGCAHQYNDVGIDTVFSLGRGAGFESALGLSVNYAPINPATWSGEARLLLRASSGFLALTIAPEVNFGFNDRDTRVKWSAESFNLGTYSLNRPVAFANSPNREVLILPATLQLQLAPVIAVEVGSALEGPLNPVTSNFANTYQVPFQGGVIVTPIPWIDVGAAVNFPNAFGKTAPSGPAKWDERQLTLFAAFRI